MNRNDIGTQVGNVIVMCKSTKKKRKQLSSRIIQPLSTSEVSGVGLIRKGIEVRSNSAGYLDKNEERHLPCDDDEEVEPVPGLCEVGVLAEGSHGRDLDEHLEGEEAEDEVVCVLQDSAAARLAHLVGARSIHAQRHAVQQDHRHAQALEPCEASSQGRPQ
ncbi:hypothetical protein AVEN_42778-1 [Araneus ventricosus]|uniref:Uncharacterized protein n=1 Tax=Araneus ventricosus TaxID=182803 RepID=A0A4Y2AED9_ARAVE|nr:hypothetical protein AVEN_42778-1 [Araneus ventricosus]